MDAHRAAVLADQQGRRGVVVDAIHLGVDAHADAGFLLDGVAVGAVAVVEAAQALDAQVLDLADLEVGVQRGREAEGRGAGVVDFELEVEAVAADRHAHLGAEGVGPQGAAGLVVGEAQGGEGEVLAGAGVAHFPQAGAGEAVLGQRATAGELGEAQRHAAADGRGAVEDCVGAEVEAIFAAGGHPGQHLGAEQADEGDGAIGRLQLEDGLAVEFGGFDVGGHGLG